MAVNVVLKSVWDDKGIKNAQSSIANFSKGLGKTFAIAGTALAAAGTAVTAFGISAAKSAEDARIAQDRLDQIAQSMGLFGDKAGEVSKRLGEFAEANQFVVGVDDEVIKATQAKLLTFENLAATADEVGGSMDRATMAALDLAAAGFGSAETNAVQLGKALQDPIKGITALGRAGVTFTETEKEKIKALVESGNILEAQNLVLSAIEKQVGGTAEATASSFTKIQLAAGEIKEQLGEALLPAVDQLAQAFITAMPAITESLAPVATALAEALIPLITELGPAVLEIFEMLAPLLMIVVEAISPLIDALSPLFDAFGRIVEAITPIIEELMPIFIQLIEMLVPVIVTLIDTFLPMVEDLLPSLIGLIESLLPFLQIMTEWWQILIGIFGKVVEILSKELIGLIDFLRVTFENLYKILGPVYEAIKPIVDALLIIAGIKPADLKKEVVVTYTEKGQISGEANRFGNLAPKTTQIKTKAPIFTPPKTKTPAGPKKETEAQKAAREQREGIEKARKIIAETAEELAKLQAENAKEIADINAKYTENVAKVTNDFNNRLADIVKQSQDRLRDAYRNAVAVNIAEIFGARTTQKVTTEIKKLTGNIQTTISRETEETVGGSVEDLVAGLRNKLESSRQLLANSAALASAGFSQTFIEQVVGAGTDTGNELAKAILEATPATQQELSDLFKAVETESETGMDALAKSIYDKAGLATTELKKLYSDTVAEQTVALKDLKDQLDKDLLETNTKFKDAVSKLKDQMIEDLAAIKTDISSLKDEIQGLIDKMNELAGIKVETPEVKFPQTGTGTSGTGGGGGGGKGPVINVTVRTDPTKSVAEVGKQLTKVINKYTGTGGGLKIGPAAV